MYALCVQRPSYKNDLSGKLALFSLMFFWCKAQRMDGTIMILKKLEPTGQRMDGRIRFLKKSEPTVQRMGKERSLIC